MYHGLDVLPSKHITALGISNIHALIICHVFILLSYDGISLNPSVVWYKNPVTFFLDESSPMHNFDLLFQDDGSRQLFYSPYSANTGMKFLIICAGSLLREV